MNKFYLVFLILSLTFLNGCSYKSHKSLPLLKSLKSEPADGPPLNPRRVDKIPNARPKPEPLSRYGNPATYEVFGKTYHVLKKTKHGQSQKGLASWYGTKFQGKRTSSGEPYDLYGMTAAHKSLPLPTYVRVKNLDNNREIIVKVNDRGPFKDDRIIDLSYAAAKKLGVFELGTAPVRITVIDPTHPNYSASENTEVELEVKDKT